MKNNLNVNVNKNFDWEIIQKELRHQFGNEIYESWLKKIVFEEKFVNHILVSVSTRFIRDWIVSRYLDQILSIIKKFNKEIVRVEFKIDNKIHPEPTPISKILILFLFFVNLRTFSIIISVSGRGINISSEIKNWLKPFNERNK